MHRTWAIGLVVSVSTLALVTAFLQPSIGVDAASPHAKKNRSSVSSSISSSRSSIASSLPSSVSSKVSSSIISVASSVSSVTSIASSASNLSLASSSRSSAPGVLWGAFVGNQLSDAATFESMVGKTMRMQSVFVGGADAFPSQYGPSVRDQGKTLVIFWEPYGLSLDSIIAGNLDTSIKRFASGALLYSGPVIFVPFPETNGDWESWNGTVGNNTPAKLITAWRRVHSFFASVPNVEFAWNVNHVSVPNTAINAISSYYPGDAYVDYVGVDGFNWGNPWQTFDQVFGPALAQLSNYPKPAMIFSMASAPGTLKAAWITDALTTQMAFHPQIRGWLWFNANKETDWRVNSDPASLDAFRNALP